MTNDEKLDVLAERCKQSVRAKQVKKPEPENDYDVTDFEPVRFIVGSLAASPVFIPRSVKIIEPGIVEWWGWFHSDKKVLSSKPPTKPERADGQKGQQGLLKDFLALENGTDEDVVTFIERWGVLGIEARESHSHQTVIRDLDWSPVSSEYSYYYWEETEKYRHWARRVRAIQNIASDLQRQQNGSIDDWAILREHNEEELAVSLYNEAIRNRTTADRDSSPCCQEAKKDLEYSKKYGLSKWSYVREILDRHPTYQPCFLVAPQYSVLLPSAQTLTTKFLAESIQDWLTIDVSYRFDAEGEIGQSRLFTVMKLSNRTRKFFLDVDLIKHSVLLPLGQTLMHSLQSPSVACKICEGVVPEAQTRRDRGQFCSEKCDAADQRTRNKESYQKRKAAIKPS